MHFSWRWGIIFLLCVLFDFFNGQVVTCVRRLRRFFQRALFILLSGALLYGMIHFPFDTGATLYVRGNLPLTRDTTAPARTMKRTAPDALMRTAEEPPPEEERVPPVEGDILALMYHDLTNDPSLTSAWTTTGEKFREDILTLLSAGYLPLSVESYIAGEYLRGQDYFIVTFDDGYLSNLTIALPILRELSVPATLFVITGSTDLANHMSWEELALFNESDLVTVYSHTNSHVRADSMSLAAFLQDEAVAWDKLTKYIQPERKVLAYPNGAFTRASMEALARDGYELFAVQHAPDWYRAENSAGIRLLVRQNVSYDAVILQLAEQQRARADLPTIQKAAEIRAEVAAAAYAARLTHCRAILDYDYARYTEARERMK